jgi:hypothetical protein
MSVAVKPAFRRTALAAKVNGHEVKKHELVSFAPHDLKELKRRVRLAVVRMRDRTELVRELAGFSKLPH